MNKLTKAAIAGAAGIALLLGGAGSLAYWNQSVAITATNVDSGSLSLTPTGSWSTTPTKWVPGDTATYTGTLAIVAVGDNFKGTLSLDTTGLFLNAPVNYLESALTVAFNVNVSGTAGKVTGSAGGPYTITAPGTYNLPVTITVTFPYGTVVDNNTQSLTADLSTVKFNVKQTP